MTSLMTTSLILFSCWVLIAKCRAGDFSENILDFYATANGRYETVHRGNYINKGLDAFNGTFKQVLVPALQKEPMLYTEEAVNGSIVRMEVGNVTESPNGDTIYIRRFNFTDPSRYPPQSFNTDDLAKFPREAFHSQPDCDAIFRKVSQGYYTGQWPDCKLGNNKQHPDFTVNITCGALYITAAVGSLETTNKWLIVNTFVGPRYPLIDAPKDYVSPCKDIQ